MALVATRREQGPPTSCHQCNEGSIYGFDVVDTDHGIHRVLCADCAMEAVEATTAEAVEGLPFACTELNVPATEPEPEPNPVPTHDTEGGE